MWKGTSFALLKKTLKRGFLGGTYLKKSKINNFFVFKDIEKMFSPRDSAGNVVPDPCLCFGS